MRKGKVLRVALGILIATFVGMLMSRTTVSVKAAELTSGKWGETSYSFDKNSGILTISGSGKMGNSGSPFSGNTDIKNVVIQSGVTSIGPGAFNGCKSLKSVMISGNVTSIEKWAFEFCSSLESISIPDSVTSIGRAAFCGCESLKEVKLSTEITAIEQEIFESCKSLKQITIPKKVTSIGEMAFAGCNSLASIDLPPIKIIEKYTFQSCFALTNVTIPNSVTEIQDGAFSACRSFTDMLIPGNVTSVGGSVFSDCSALTDIYFKNGVQSIGGSVFWNCDNLKNLYLPESLNKMGDLGMSSSKLTIHGKSGSYAEQYAKSQNIAFETEGSASSASNNKTDQSNDRWDFSKDSFSFENFVHSSDKKKIQFGCLDVISEQDLDELKSHACPACANLISLILSGSGYLGHCYGMATAAILQKDGIINFAKDVNSSAENLHGVSKKQALSRLCMYQLFQGLDRPCANRQSFSEMTESMKLQKLEEEVTKAQQEGKYVLLSYRILSDGEDKGGHSVVAYGIEQGNYSDADGTQINGQTYDSKVLIYDSNYGGKFSDSACLYLKKGTSDCIIPYWNRKYPTSITQISIDGVLSDIRDINAYDDGSTGGRTELTLQRASNLDITSEDGSRWIYRDGKLSGSSGASLYYDLGEDESLEKIIHIVLPENNQNYAVTPSSGTITIAMRYQNTSVAVSSAHIGNIVFYKDGSVKVNGNQGKFAVSVADNKKASQNYHTFKAEGNGQGDINIVLTNEGADISGTAVKGATVTEEGKSKKNSKKITGEVHLTQTISGENQESSVQTEEMYRLYNPNSGEHFYTASSSERDYLSKIGWRDEGIAWNNPKKGIPVYRLYNPNAGDHHYTTSAGERDFLVKVGWKAEGVGWHASKSSGTAVYRLYNPNAKKAGAHHYTTKSGERNSLVRVGWKAEGIGWYAA